VEQVLTTRLVERYPVFSQRPISERGTWKWAADPDFSLERHLTHVTLPQADGEDLRRYIGSQFGEPLPRDRPLWKIEVIHGVSDLDGKERPVLLSSFHHSVADGIRLVQVTLGLCDNLGDATPKVVGRGGDEGRYPLIEGAITAVRQGVSDGVDLGIGATKASLALPLRTLQALVDPEAFKAGINAGFELLVNPSNVIDLVESITREDNATVNTGSELTRLLSASSATKTTWSGEPSQAKQVAWVSDLPLAPLKRVARHHDGTVNDAMLAVISRGLTAYLREHDSMVDQIQWLIPVSIQPLDAELPTELGNHFALVYLEMPLGIDEPDRLFVELQQRMLRIKHSAVPILTSGLQWLVAESPKQIAVALTNFFANKGTGVLTNV
ncbi:MAG TPA: wax ester/triacylglycerol synthase family O-acyltransferase, partial [Marmoricola sp.]|nr:wax ester/triacylglycerol synthase family O-acyltransferase [Marmoricola sp.]